MILQLNPSVPVTTPKGKGLAHILIDMGAEHNLLWVVFLDDNGECWTFSNPDIRAQKNVTMGREYISPFYDPESVSFKNPMCSVCTADVITHYKLDGVGLCDKCAQDHIRDDPPEDFTNV